MTNIWQQVIGWGDTPIERPISTRRKRKLRKKGKNVYWSKRLECNVYVMEPKQ